MAPIGIITALVSTIRLCGSTALRAFIGRSQEGQGAVEAELCTSTSRDVCELFTRGGIQRVLGRPSILELVFLPRIHESGRPMSDKDEKSPCLLLSREYFSKYVRASDAPWTEIGGASTTTKVSNPPSVLAPNPNLSLNIGVRRPSGWVLWSVACIGILLQAGVLVLAGIGVWILGWDLSDGGGPAARDYAPIMFIVGTILMCAGMWGCAFLIGQTTQEIGFKRKAYKVADEQPRLLWLQPGPQVIGDQSFDSFAYIDYGNAVQAWSSSRKLRHGKFELYTYLTVLGTLVGYIMHFIAIRGMQAWVSLAQLAVTVIMRILRGSLRTQRLENKDNYLRRVPDMVAGFELDWLAFELVAQGRPDAPTTWHITGQHEKVIVIEHSVSSHANLGDAMPLEHAVDRDRINDEVLQIRLQLADLTGLHSSGEPSLKQYQTWDDKHVKVRAKARQLATSINSAAAEWLSTKTTIRRDEEVTLRVFRNISSEMRDPEPIKIELRPSLDFTQAGWRSDTAQLEAMLGLWLWSMVFQENTRREDPNGQADGHVNELPVISDAFRIPTSRIVAIGLEGPNWEKNTDMQEEMILWLGRSSIKFRQSKVRFLKQRPHSLATIFQRYSEDSWVPCPSNPGIWSRGVQRGFPVPELMHRFCGWSSAHRATAAHRKLETTDTEAGNEVSNQEMRIQYTQIDLTITSLLDICCQELFVALMMSLVEFGDTPIGSPTFVEHEGSLRLEHPVVSTFAAAFVESKLGNHSDALTCIVPALRERISSLHPQTMLPALVETATRYRRAGEWKRARVMLQFGCSQVDRKDFCSMYIQQALRSLLELFRWALSKFSPEERDFGLDGLKVTLAT